MIIAVDFDGTLCDDGVFPNIVGVNNPLITWLKHQKNLGHRLILWTCREGSYLAEAEAWCIANGLEFDAVNDNIPELRGGVFGKHKIIADIYLDDKAMQINRIVHLDNAENFVRGET